MTFTTSQLSPLSVIDSPPPSLRDKPLRISISVNGNANANINANATSDNGTVQGKHNKNGETVILMYDTRSLDVDISKESYVYWRWTADLNYHYARRHGYDFIYMQDETQKETYQDKPAEAVDSKADGVDSKYKTRAQCSLVTSNNLTVPRGAPWCKLLALASVLERGYYSTIVVIDADAFFKQNAPDIDTIIDQYRNAKRDSLIGPQPILWVPNNAPWGKLVPNSGLLIWKLPASSSSSWPPSSAAAWRLLRQWWQVNVSPKKNAYEQDALWDILNITKKFRDRGSTRLTACGIGLLELGYMLKGKWHVLPVTHLNSAFKADREEVIRSYWANLTSTSNQQEVLDKVESLQAAEVLRLQSLLASEADNLAC